MFALDMIHPSFSPFFEENAALIEKIYEKIGDSPFLPESTRVFRFASRNAACVRAVILGQDPYPQPGAATGRSFEVAGLHSWLEPFRQTSLRNILRAIYLAKTGETLTFREIRALIASGGFSISPPDILWDRLEEQGVLFLNTYLTVEPGKPLSHRALWREFAERLVRFLDSGNAGAAWFLWGADARSFAPFIMHGAKYESRHPMMCGPWDDDFLRNPCFRETRDVIDWCGNDKKV